MSGWRLVRETETPGYLAAEAFSSLKLFVATNIHRIKKEFFEVFDKQRKNKEFMVEFNRNLLYRDPQFAQLWKIFRARYPKGDIEKFVSVVGLVHRYRKKRTAYLHDKVLGKKGPGKKFYDKLSYIIVRQSPMVRDSKDHMQRIDVELQLPKAIQWLDYYTSRQFTFGREYFHLAADYLVSLGEKAVPAIVNRTIRGFSRIVKLRNMPPSSQAQQEYEKEQQVLRATASILERMGAVDALASLVEEIRGNKEYREEFCTILPEIFNITHLIEHIGKIGGNRGIETIRECLTEENKEVRIAAAMALGKAGDKKAVPHLIDIIREYASGSEKDWFTKIVKQEQEVSAVSILKEKRWEEAVPGLIELFRIRSGKPWIYSMEILEGYGSGIIPAVLTHLERGGREPYYLIRIGMLLQRLGGLGERELDRITVLLDQAKTKKEKVGFIRLIGALGDKRAEKLLRNMIRMRKYRPLKRDIENSLKLITRA